MSIIVLNSVVALYGIIIISIILFYYVLLMWVNIDAQENSSYPTILWLIIVFFMPLIGFVLYITFGRDEL